MKCIIQLYQQDLKTWQFGIMLQVDGNERTNNNGVRELEKRWVIEYSHGMLASHKIAQMLKGQFWGKSYLAKWEREIKGLFIKKRKKIIMVKICLYILC